MKYFNITEKSIEYIISRSKDQIKNLDKRKIARELGLDIQILCSSFKSERGISLDNFISKEKIYRAVYAFENNLNKSIEDIAGELGFGGVDIFCMEFEKVLYIGPHLYKNIKKNALRS